MGGYRRGQMIMEEDSVAEQLSNYKKRTKQAGKILFL